MKLKTLLLLSLICFNFINPQEEINKQIPVECEDWFPEPKSYKNELINTNLTEKFKIIDEFLVDRNMNESWKMVEDYVIEMLNGSSSGGYLDIVRIVFKQLPSVRQLTIAIFCIKISLIIVLFLWKLGLGAFFEILGNRLNLDENRAGITIIPIFCILGLLIMTSNISAPKVAIVEGLEKFETSNDKSFMPIQERIKKKLSKMTCLFNRDLVTRLNEESLVKRYMKLTKNNRLFIPVINILEAPDDVQPDECSRLKKYTYIDVSVLTRSLISDLHKGASLLNEEYSRIIAKSLTASTPALVRALGGIEQFVKNYHENILLIPSTRIINFYNSIISTIVVSGIFMTISLTVLMLIKFEFRRKWSQRIIGASVPVTIIFSVLCLLVFIALITRICFIVLVHEICQENEFEIFQKGKSVNISGNGTSFSVNYGTLLKRSVSDKTSLFHLLSDKEDETPDMIKMGKMFEPSEKFNKYIGQLVEHMNDYEKYLEVSCEKSQQAYDNIAKNMKNESNCTDQGYSEIALKMINKTTEEFCTAFGYLKLHPLDKEYIRRTAYSKWLESLHPQKNQSIFDEKTVIDDRNPMQVYMVFENPSKKLRPTILEHMLHMASLIVTVTPIFVVLTVYFICILPLLMSDPDNDGSENKTSKTSSNSSSNSKSKSNSPSEEKSRTLSNEKLVTVAV